MDLLDNLDKLLCDYEDLQKVKVIRPTDIDEHIVNFR